MKILEEFVVEAWPDLDGYVRFDLDCASCSANVMSTDYQSPSQGVPLYLLIHQASEHKKICPNGPMAALDAMRGES